MVSLIPIIALISFFAIAPNLSHSTPIPTTLSKRYLSLGPETAPYYTPWPTHKGHDGITRIPYCYRDVIALLNNAADMAAATTLWESRVGDVVRFRAVNGTDGSALCYAPDGVTPRAGIPDDAVVISYQEGTSTGSVGCYGDSKDFGRHEVAYGRPGNEKEWWTAIMAHELGHVLGLRHEHQHPNAATVFKFSCKNLSDYDDFAARIAAYPKFGHTVAEVCESRALAVSIGWFAAAQFMPFDAAEVAFGWESSEVPDAQSLMRYSSTDGAKDAEHPTLRLIDRSTTPPVLRVLPKVSRPSEGDITRVRAIYS